MRRRIDAEERFPRFDPVADLLQHGDARSLIDRRAGHAGEPIETQAVDAFNHTVPVGRYIDRQRPKISGTG